ncbi:hypothetical protein EMCRGX_G023290 [Ephydatia muelleri]
MAAPQSQSLPLCKNDISIDISNASFTYEVENLPKHQFEICVGSSVYSFQASTREVMLHWLEQLKEKRRTLGTRSTNNSPLVTCVGEGGLISSHVSVQPRDDTPATTLASGLRPSTPNAPTSPAPTTPPLEQRQQDRPKTTWERMTNILKPTPTPLKKPTSNFYVDTVTTEGDASTPAALQDTKPGNASEGTDGPQSVPKPALNNKKISTSIVEGGLVTQWFQKVKSGTGGVGGVVTVGGGTEACVQCAELQRQLEVKKQELCDRDEINEYLRGEVRVLHMKFKVREEMQTIGVMDERRIDVVVQREQTIEELQRLLEECCRERDELKTELGAKRMEVQCFAEELQLCKESLSTKDSIVMGLTNKISELENHGQVFTNPRDALLPKGSRQYEEETVILKESVEAYKKQNQFLSAEIIELKGLRDEDLKTRNELLQKIKNMETDLFKVMQMYTALRKERMEEESEAEGEERVSEEVDLVGEGVDLVGVEVDLVGEEVDLVGEEVDLVGEEVDLVGEEVDLVGEEVDLVGEEVNLVGEEVDLVGVEVDLVGVEVDLVGEEVDLVGEEVDLVGEEVDLVGEEVDLMGEEVNLVGVEVDLVGVEVDLVGEEVDLVGEEVDLVGVEVDLVGEEVDLVGEEVDLMGEEVDLVGEEVDLVGEEVDLVGEEVDLVGEEVDLVGEEVDLVGEEVDLVGEEVDLVGEEVDPGGSFDQYGFNIHGYEEENPEAPLAKIQRRLDRQVHLQEAQAAASAVAAEWSDYMCTLGKSELTRSAELKDLIRKGVSDSYRGRVWKWCIYLHLDKRHNPGWYQKLLSDSASRNNTAVGQIELDLLRTLPTNKYFSQPDSIGIEKLRRVLLAYSCHDPDVGYCQGINRLAAVALLFMDEEDAFWCLDCIINCLHPPHYYTKSLLGSQTDQRVLKDLLQEKLPKLTQHLQMCDIDYALVTFNWFHTVFVDNMPIETMMRIWDTFLYEGSKVLFRYAIAIFKHNEEQLLALDNSISIFNHLRTMCPNALDADRITKIAFTEITHFSIRDINRKRKAHMAVVQAELEEVEKCRAQPSQNQYSMKALTSDSDEESWKEELIDLPN